MGNLVDDFMQPTGELSADEQQRLAELEGVIQSNLFGFRQVCSALWEIKRDCLYRGKYKDFPDYIRRRWDGIQAEISNHRLYQLAQAGEVLEDLQAHCTNGAMNQPLPTNERQTRALLSTPREARKDVYQFALEKNEGKPPSARQIEEAKVEVLAPENLPSESRIERWARNYRPLNQDSPSGRLKRCLDTLRDIEDTARAALNTGQTWYGKALEHIMELCEGLADLQPR